MTEDGGPRVSSDVSGVTTDASQTRKRKKRKWDQPAECLIGVSLPGMAPSISTAAAASLLTKPLAASHATVPPMVLQGSSVSKSKVQDELIIARELVINDAESSVRYKLTKRQMQEEIQRCTGAVVITRGKYRPPNTLSDGEKPLYLHISAAAHLKETAERILAVDRAAAIVEEILKQGTNPNTGFPALQTPTLTGSKVHSTCLFLGFDADPSLNIAARIRGPNDQYINHIMNETGATVVLRGRGSGNFEGLNGAEAQQPLHLFLSSNNHKSLEDAKLLAENLLDTISVEFGASRLSSSKVYNAVPPPQQLLPTIQSSGYEQSFNSSSSAGFTSTVSVASAPAVSSIMGPGVPSAISHGTLSHPGVMLNSSMPQPKVICHPQPVLTGGTSYSGYEGIYPQATPLQQVALALRQSSPFTSSVAPTTSAATTVTKSNCASMSEERRTHQRRKFQELPVGSKGSTKVDQASELLNPSEASADVKSISNMPAPKKLVQPSSYGMPPPPPPPLSKSMPPPPPRMMPPPPPKFTLSTPTVKLQDKKDSLIKIKSDGIPDTLVKLMEYGDDDDDDEDDPEESRDESICNTSNFEGNSSKLVARKPFWAV